MERGRIRVGAVLRAGAAATLALTLANCGRSTGVDPKYGVSASPRVVAAGQAVPKGGGRYSVGRPYQIAGRTYVPRENPDYSATGIASWYGDDFHGRKTANGEIFDMHSIAAAHPTLPLPSYVRVTNLRNKRSLVVRVNDRGPFHQDRVIDLSARAADLLGFQGHGVARVRVDYVGRASLDGSDDVKLAATLRHDGRTPASAPSEVRVAASQPSDARPAPISTSAPAPRAAATRTAAAQTFRSEYFDPTPMVGRTRAEPAAQQAPRPAARPPAVQGPQLASVESRPVSAPQPQPGRMVWNEGPAPAQQASFNSRFGNASPAAPSAGPAAAYAPVRHDGALMTGRGLY